MKAFRWSSLFVWIAAVSLTRNKNASALHAEDAGVLDFLVATAGHGTNARVLHATDSSVITSDSGSLQWSRTSSCVVASRSIQDGSLQWRRNVCTSKNTLSHAAVASSDYIVTNDAHGSAKAWTVDEGALLWNTPPQSVRHRPRIWGTDTIVAATSTDDKGNDVLSLYSTVNGSVMGSVSANGVASNAQWLHVMPHPEKDGILLALAGHVSFKLDQPTAEKLFVMELAVTQEKVQVDNKKKVSASTSFLVSTMVVQRMADKDFHVLALSTDRLQMVHFSLSTSFSQNVSQSQLHPLWTSMVSILPTSQVGMIRVVGRDNRYPTDRDSMAMYRFDGQGIWDQRYEGEEETKFRAIAECSNFAVAIEHSGGVVAFDVGTVPSIDDSNERLTRTARHNKYSPLVSLPVSGDVIPVTEKDAVTRLDVLSCDKSSMTALLTTAAGTTVQMTAARNMKKSMVTVNVDWTAEEGLANISDALLLDGSHSAAVLEALSEAEEAEALRQLSFSARMQSQWNDGRSFLTQSGTASSRDVDFGFVKVATLLSQTSHRLYGMPTSGPSRGKVSWTVDLPPNADWHVLVHGTSSSRSAVHGINGGTHSPEVLVLSSIEDYNMFWMCLDGTTGQVHSIGTIGLESPVVQVMPLFGGFGVCRQLAVLVHKDHSIKVVPGDDKGKEAILEHLDSSQNGMYSHIVDRDANTLQSFQITRAEEEEKEDEEEPSPLLAAKLVGHTAFPGEEIVEVAYPKRDEVVQAPSKVLGDDSLLLKYLNPHLAVIITTAKDSSEPDEISRALHSEGGDGKRKPLGATQPGEAAPETTTTEDAPNMFVNIVDTVSSRVLYRVSHSNASPSQDIPILISENWIFYAFFNEKVRRTELGVLTLYEGMIDKNGLTAFTSPEQALSFSSMEARDAKPVVLSKTYVLQKPVTALGITSTRGGISSRHVLFACRDDKILQLPREMLEPRRPTGDVKDSEKKEGLVKYAPLVPFMSVWSPSYNQTVESVTTIVSTSASLESQSLVLAYGGPDIFFTRLSPSKGFDLLPESFNRLLLVLVVLGLVVAVGVARNMGSKKTVTVGWS